MTPAEQPIVIDFSPAVMGMVDAFYWLAVAALVLELGKWLTTPRKRNR